MPIKKVWCARPDLNRYGLYDQRILSPLRLPFPPLAHTRLIFKKPPLRLDQNISLAQILVILTYFW